MLLPALSCTPLICGSMFSQPLHVENQTPSICESMSEYRLRNFFSLAASAFHMPRPEASSMRLIMLPKACGFAFRSFAAISSSNAYVSAPCARVGGLAFFLYFVQGR